MSWRAISVFDRHVGSRTAVSVVCAGCNRSTTGSEDRQTFALCHAGPGNQLHRTPLVLGTSSLPVRDVASFSAKASALKADSDLHKVSSHDVYTAVDVPVVVVLSPKAVDVQRDVGCYRERMEDVRDHLARQVADLFPFLVGRVNAISPPGTKLTSPSSATQ
jgi:hypothetical protein